MVELMSRDALIQSATDEEFKAEAKRRGYNIIKKPEPVKLLPCVCGTGRRKVEQWVNAYGRYYKCDNCGLESFVGRSERKAKLYWNRLIEIERKIKDAEKENG